MGLLDTALGMLSNAQQTGNGSQGNLVQAALGLLNQSQNGGGLQNLISSFQQAGLGEVIASWVSTGQNLPISAEQIQQALGGGQLSQLANASGLSQSDTAGGLAAILPNLIDQMTPNGQVSDAGSIDPSAMLQQFTSLFGQR
ncbi:YidB family protein [Undibacterium sp.]|uniref:YidB family protein n=1 Tax=Undibacterium sp. TaxID=1914977 RepID=UPI0037528281